MGIYNATGYHSLLMLKYPEIRLLKLLCAAVPALMYSFTTKCVALLSFNNLLYYGNRKESFRV